MNELNKLYKAMLESMGAIIKESNEIVYSLNGKEFPLTINGNSLYLPTSEMLDGNTIDKVFFHPACEHILSKETEVFKILRKITIMSLLTQFNQLVPVILKVSKGNTKKTWKKDLIEFVGGLKGLKAGQVKEVIKMLGKITPDVPDEGPDLRFVHLRTTKGGGRSTSLNERVYYKTIPSFPFYNELIKRLARSEGNPDNSQVELAGDSFSRGSIKALVHMFQHMLPSVTDPDDCLSESTNPTAARLVSYLGCYVEIAEQLNRSVNNFRVEFNKEGIYPIEINWFEDFDNIEDIYQQVPMLDYNGHSTKDEVSTTNNHLSDDYFNVTGNSPTSNAVANQHNQGHNPYGHTVNPNHVNQTSVDGYDTTVPTMQAGDQFVKTDIDYIQQRVIHNAINRTTGMPVRYVMTRHGNLLMREETTPQGNANALALGLLGSMNQNALNAQNNMGGMNLAQMLQLQQMGMLNMGATTSGGSSNNSNAPVTDSINHGALF